MSIMNWVICMLVRYFFHWRRGESGQGPSAKRQEMGQYTIVFARKDGPRSGGHRQSRNSNSLATGRVCSLSENVQYDLKPSTKPEDRHMMVWTRRLIEMTIHWTEFSPSSSVQQRTAVAE